MKFPTFLVKPLVDWAFNNVEDVLDVALPAIANALKLKPEAERTLRIVVPALVEGAMDIHEASPDFQTTEGALAVLAEIKDFIDETGDEWPVWDNWTEAERDTFLVHTFISLAGFVKIFREAVERDEPIRKKDVKKAVKRTFHPFLRRQTARLKAQQELKDRMQAIEAEPLSE